MIDVNENKKFEEEDEAYLKLQIDANSDSENRFWKEAAKEFYKG